MSKLAPHGHVRPACMNVTARLAGKSVLDIGYHAGICVVRLGHWFSTSEISGCPDVRRPLFPHAAAQITGGRGHLAYDRHDPIRRSMFRPAWHDTPGNQGRRGYTLLEILIVSLLLAVLMLGVWSLFRTWSRLYEKGERRVQSAQLVRSLCDQFADDVRAVAYVPPPPQEQRESNSGGQSGSTWREPSSARGNVALVGGTDWLVLEVIQPPSPFMQPVSTTSDMAEDTATMSYSAPELQRVMYTFEPPVSDALDSLSSTVADLAALDDTEAVGDEEEVSEPFTGLLRLVVPEEQYEELAAPAGNAGFSRSSPGLSDTVWQLRYSVVGTDTEATDALLPDVRSTSSDVRNDPTGSRIGIVAQDEVPEVVWLAFRYFDGSTWRSSWNSQNEKRLPVAVELRFELEAPEDEEKALSRDAETELVDDVDTSQSRLDAYPLSEGEIALPSDPTQNSIDTDDEETPYHRCVVYLEPPAEQPQGVE